MESPERVCECPKCGFCTTVGQDSDETTWQCPYCSTTNAVPTEEDEQRAMEAIEAERAAFRAAFQVDLKNGLLDVQEAVLAAMQCGLAVYRRHQEYREAWRQWMILRARLSGEPRGMAIQYGRLNGPFGLKGAKWRDGYGRYWRLHSILVQENAALFSQAEAVAEGLGGAMEAGASALRYADEDGFWEALAEVDDDHSLAEFVRNLRENVEKLDSWRRTMANVMSALKQNWQSDLHDPIDPN